METCYHFKVLSLVYCEGKKVKVYFKNKGPIFSNALKQFCIRLIIIWYEVGRVAKFACTH